MLYKGKTLESRVQKGIAWLDRKDPEWANKVNLDSLNMWNCSRCVVGQVFGNFWTLFRRSWERKTEWDNRTARARAVELGFADPDSYAGEDKSDAYYGELSRIWKAEIAARQALTKEVTA